MFEKLVRTKYERLSIKSDTKRSANKCCRYAVFRIKLESTWAARYTFNHLCHKFQTIYKIVESSNKKTLKKHQKKQHKQVTQRIIVFVHVNHHRSEVK